MNIDKASAGLTDAPLAPVDWTMDLTQSGKHYTAEVRRAGVLMCRITSALPEYTDQAAARRELADRARIWIHEFLATRSG